MASSISDTSNRRGPGVMVRMPPDQLAALDAFIAKQPKKVSRPEAIRAFVATGLEATREGG